MFLEGIGVAFVDQKLVWMRDDRVRAKQRFQLFDELQGNLEAVEHVDELTQPSVVAAVEPESDAGKVDVLIVLSLFGSCLNDLDRFAGDDVFEVLVEALHGVSG